MSKPERAKYRTTNWTEYNAALKRRGSLMVWLDTDLQWQASSTGKTGRPAVFSDAAIQFCLTLKCMFGLDCVRPQAWPRACCGLPGSIGQCPTTALCAADRRL